MSKLPQTKYIDKRQNNKKTEVSIAYIMAMDICMYTL